MSSTFILSCRKQTFLPSGSQEAAASEYQERGIAILAENSFYSIQHLGKKYYKKQHRGSKMHPVQLLMVAR